MSVWSAHAARHYRLPAGLWTGFLSSGWSFGRRANPPPEGEEGTRVLGEACRAPRTLLNALKVRRQMPRQQGYIIFRSSCLTMRSVLRMTNARSMTDDSDGSIERIVRQELLKIDVTLLSWHLPADFQRVQQRPRCRASLAQNLVCLLSPSGGGFARRPKDQPLLTKPCPKAAGKAIMPGCVSGPDGHCWEPAPHRNLNTFGQVAFSIQRMASAWLVNTHVGIKGAPIASSRYFCATLSS